MTTLTHTDLRGAPLVGMTQDDWFTEMDDTTPTCRLCRNAPGRLALGYHDGNYCYTCVEVIIDSQNCPCPVWTPRELWLNLCQINTGIRQGDDPEEWVTIWKCTEGIES